MFRHVGRRLALLNAAVVVGVIAVTGLCILVLLQQALNHEEAKSLEERVESARVSWRAAIVSGDPSGLSELNINLSNNQIKSENGSHQTDGDGDEDDGGDSDSLLETSDTFLFGFDAAGTLVIDERGVPFQGLPDTDSVAVALTGKIDTRTVSSGGQRVRVRSEPLIEGGKIVGVVQGARGQGEHESQRRLTILFSLVGIALGIVIAVPAGLFLARRAMQPVEQSFAKQRAFVADASHELRTPLSVIRAQAELIQRLVPAEQADVREEVGIVVAEVDEMNRLVSDLLLLARLDEQGGLVAFDPIDVRDLAADVVAAHEGRAAAAGLSLTFSGVMPLPVSGDADRVKQVIRVLVDNAVKYTPAGGTIVVTTEQRGGDARLSVRDSGIGIAAEDQARIFERFFRSEKARSRSSGGTGLGLSIAEGLVRSMHGQIGVESQLGSGSTFWFTLPLRKG